MSFTGLIADMDLDRVKLELEIKTESEVIALDTSPDSAEELDMSSTEQTGGKTVNEYQAEIKWALLEIESDKEEGKNGNLIENNNSQSSENESGLNYNTIHEEPAALLLKFTITPSKKDLVAKFTKYGVLIGTEICHEDKTVRVVFARKKDAESAFRVLNGSGEFKNIRMRCLPAELAGPPPAVLSEVREKLTGIVESLNGSGLDLETDLVGDAKDLLGKVNVVMSKDCFVNNKAIIKV